MSAVAIKSMRGVTRTQRARRIVANTHIDSICVSILSRRTFVAVKVRCWSDPRNPERIIALHTREAITTNVRTAATILRVVGSDQKVSSLPGNESERERMGGRFWRRVDKFHVSKAATTTAKISSSVRKAVKLK
jgi:hypothetical protein